METLGSSPLTWLEFDKDGRLHDPDLAGLKDLVTSGVGEIVIMAHGWKNNRADATKLYGTLWDRICRNLGSERAKAIGIVGVLWPAKAYETDFDTERLADVGDGQGALALGDDGAPADLDHEEFERRLAAFEDFFGAEAAATIEAARDLGRGISADSAGALVDAGSDLVALESRDRTDPELTKDAAPIAKARSDEDKAVFMMEAISNAPTLRLDESVGKSQGLPDAVTSLIRGSRAAAARFLNQLTYFEMKARAGVVGRSLAETVLAKVAPKQPLKFHLVGHSFGARLVTAAANVLVPPENMEFYSVTLLQGAFSHNALAQDVEGMPGAFKDAVGKPTGPFVITHTHNDLACTLAYAIASRLSRTTAEAIGDAADIYGAMGANGPQRLRSGDAQPDNVKQPFAFVRGKINPVLADRFIVKTPESDAHNNVTNDECGVLLAAVLLA